MSSETYKSMSVVHATPLVVTVCSGVFNIILQLFIGIMVPSCCCVAHEDACILYNFVENHLYAR
jgi:hypothetical protein